MKHHLLPSLGAATILAIAGGSAAFADPYSEGDCNCDGIVNSADYNDIYTYWLDDPAFPGFGDANHDGVVNFSDFTAWLGTENNDYRPDPIDGMDLSASYAGSLGAVSLTDDNNSNQAVIASTDLGIWEDTGPSTEIEPSVSFLAKADGFDIVYTFDNSMGGVAKSPGSLVIPGLALGSGAKVRDFAHDGAEQVLGVSPWVFECCNGANEWPRVYWYSPVGVVSNSEYTIGASIQYPVLSYKHSVRVSYLPHVYSSTTYTRIKFNLGNGTDEADIPPGQTRVYTVSVRVLDRGLETEDEDDEDWMRTLLEYRRYFRCMYQEVRYARDPRPVAAVQIADPSFFGGSSHGYDPNIDPADMDGWLDVAEWAEDRFTMENFHRAMIWTPTGFQTNGNNYAFRFTSEVWDTSEFPSGTPDHPIRSTLGLVRDLTDSTIMGREDWHFGLWWGRAAQVPDPFDWNAEGQVNVVLDPTDTSMGGHVELALTELDYAVNDSYGFGANMVGLDAFTELPPWDGYWWLKQLQAAAPGVKFITEGRHCDLMHTLAPTYDYMFYSGNYKHPTPPLIADFLNPGHEYWLQPQAGGLNCPPGMETCDPEDWGPAWESQAALGYVLRIHGSPLWFDAEEQDMSSNYIYNAAETWLTTVPSDLQP